MASINDVTIKSLKSFIGMEGEAWQGNVYIDGKKAGFWSQDANGAICDTFDFDTSALAKKASEWYAKNPPIDTIAVYSAGTGHVDMDNLPRKTPSDDILLECFMDDLLNLSLHEKDYKKNVRKGYPVTGYIDFLHTKGEKAKYPYTCGGISEKVITDLLDEERKEYPTARLALYTKPEDFILTTQ